MFLGKAKKLRILPVLILSPYYHSSLFFPCLVILYIPLGCTRPSKADDVLGNNAVVKGRKTMSVFQDKRVFSKTFVTVPITVAKNIGFNQQRLLYTEDRFFKSRLL